MQPHHTYRETADPQHESPPDPTPQFRDRLVRFYKHYDPTKLIVVDGMVADSMGNEDQLFEALVRLYGPEPPPDEPSLQNDAERDRVGERLRRFYNAYNPSKIADIPEVIKTFAGREAELFDALIKKYGPEPASAPQITPHENYSSDPPDEMLAIIDQSKSLRQTRYKSAVTMLLKKHESRLLLKHYYRWLEVMWWKKNKDVLERVMDDGKGGILIEKKANQQLREQVEFLREKVRVEKELNDRQLQEYQESIAAAREQQPLPPPLMEEKLQRNPSLKSHRCSWRLPVSEPQPARRQSLKPHFSSLHQPLYIPTTESIGCGPSPVPSPSSSPHARAVCKDSIKSADRSLLIDELLSTQPGVQESDELQSALDRYVPVPEKQHHQKRSNIHVHIEPVAKNKKKGRSKRLSDTQTAHLVDELVAGISGMGSFPSTHCYYCSPQSMQGYSSIPMHSIPPAAGFMYHSSRDHRKTKKNKKKRSASKHRTISQPTVIDYSRL
eukprot:TRINITY_DN3446_c0_g1_i1.p1 TRINITY_DN3446_c0_g1~~TRINITY_DN3446_c0_g1_i1.p1  ORF type:complete len:497 (+),score=94.96 TRINITY_DN3446_c0_g1_i1:37-1527(+)